MEYLLEFNQQTRSITQLPPSLPKFLQLYDAPGAFPQLRTAEDIGSVLTAHSFFCLALQGAVAGGELQYWVDETRANIITNMGRVFHALKIFTRLGADVIPQLFTLDFVATILNTHIAAVKLYNQLISMQITPEDEKFNNVVESITALLYLRLESTRTLQNMAIINRSQVHQCISTSQCPYTKNDLLKLLFQMVEGTYHDKEDINTNIISTILSSKTNPTSITLCEIFGMTDLSYTLRCVLYLVAEDDNKNKLANNGLISSIYNAFLSASSTKVFSADETIPELPKDQNCTLFYPSSLSPKAVNIAGIDITSLPTPTGSNQLICDGFHALFNDLSRVLLVFGALNNSDEHIAFFAENCFTPEPTDDEKTKGTQLYQRFVERILVILGAGMKDSDVPEPISSVVKQIVSHDDILNKYMIPGTQIGYSKHQAIILEQYSNKLIPSDSTTIPQKEMAYPYNCKSIAFEDVTSTLYLKLSLVRFLVRLPLKYCPFFFTHQNALAFIWKLFELSVESMAPLPQPQTKPLVDDQQEVTYVLPVLELMINILEAASEMEKQSYASATQEQMIYYASLGISPLSDIVKKLLFGIYANKDVDETHRALLLAKMHEEDPISDTEEKEAEDEANQDQDGPDDGEEAKVDDNEEEEECDDFEAFAEEAMDTKKAQLNKKRMDVKEFLKSLPKPKRQHTTQMIPAGGLSESLLDDVDNTSVKARALNLMLSGHFKVATLIQELLYRIAGEQSDEYVRLCGFGRAVGLLTSKGLPGFAHLSQNAISLDSLMGQK